VFSAEDVKTAAEHAKAFVAVNQVVHWSIVWTTVGICIGLAIHAWQAVRELRRLARGQRNGAALQPSH
jgi:hypothetical protein